MIGRLDWERDGRDWPHREASRFVETMGLRWHVQIMGQGPTILLIHGTGASTHSWRQLLPLLSRSFTVVTPDLPGHGFTAMSDRSHLSLPGMAAAIGDLMHALQIDPALAVGHSAGAAIAIRSTLDGLITPRVIVSINGALLPFGSWVGGFFSPLAKLLVSAPVVPRIMAWQAQSRSAVERVIVGTGSHVPPRDIDFYARLFRSPSHVAAALGMMASWDLQSFAIDLPHLKTKLVLVTASKDKAISPKDARKVLLDLVPSAMIERVEGGGHLVHEERPEEIADIIFRAAESRATSNPKSHNGAGKKLLR